MTGGCLLVAFAPDRATGNDDDDYIVSVVSMYVLCTYNIPVQYILKGLL